mmetsp:Transcript_126619/g.339736  ORF Transcript_126619/g.339736 Transcript_126619/m.339736 type:complete len:228 (+) Transcript_126619:1716-2399(+)
MARPYSNTAAKVHEGAAEVGRRGLRGAADAAALHLQAGNEARSCAMRAAGGLEARRHREAGGHPGGQRDAPASYRAAADVPSGTEGGTELGAGDNSVAVRVQDVELRHAAGVSLLRRSRRLRPCPRALQAAAGQLVRAVRHEERGPYRHLLGQSRRLGHRLLARRVPSAWQGHRRRRRRRRAEYAGAPRWEPWAGGGNGLHGHVHGPPRQRAPWRGRTPRGADGMLS